MVYVYVVVFFLAIFIAYFLYKSYPFQFFYHKHRIKKLFIKDFKNKVRGRYSAKAYFAPSHKIISNSEYHASTNRQKVNFSECYNVIRFKTVDIDWEIYFNLIRDGSTFTEVFNLRAFSRNYKIKSEGNVEKSYSRINVFTNNSYLTQVLEKQANDDLKWLVRYNGDILLISHNNLHFKAFLDAKHLSVSRVIDMVKAMNNIKSKVYKKDVIEY